LEILSEMDSLSERAAQWGIATEYWDGLGHHRRVEPEVLARCLVFGMRGLRETARNGKEMRRLIAVQVTMLVRSIDDST